MHAFVAISESGKELLYPHASELILGAIAFFILLAFMWKWVFPRINAMLDARRAKIQGDLEQAEEAKTEAQRLLDDYRQQLAGARDEANRVIEEARKTAEAMRRDLLAKAEQENQAVLGRAQEEIRAERDRVFQELKSQVSELSIALAAKVVGHDLDGERQRDLVEEYIRELSEMPSGNGHGPAGSGS